jgi:hypothetical protein
MQNPATFTLIAGMLAAVFAILSLKRVVYGSLGVTSTIPLMIGMLANFACGVDDMDIAARIARLLGRVAGACVHLVRGRQVFAFFAAAVPLPGSA